MARNSIEVRELRLSGKDQKSAKAGEGGFAAGGHFFALMEMLLPEFQNQLRIRVVGRLGGMVIFAFAQIPGGTLDRGIATRAEARVEPVQGLVWIDAKSARVARLRCDVTLTQEASAVEEQIIDLTFTDVRFDALDATLLLPARAAFDVSWGSVRAHAVHRFSEFQLYGRDDGNDPELPKKNAGVYSARFPPTSMYVNDWLIGDHSPLAIKNSRSSTRSR